MRSTVQCSTSIVKCSIRIFTVQYTHSTVQYTYSTVKYTYSAVQCSAVHAWYITVHSSVPVQYSALKMIARSSGISQAHCTKIVQYSRPIVKLVQFGLYEFNEMSFNSGYFKIKIRPIRPCRKNYQKFLLCTTDVLYYGP